MAQQQWSQDRYIRAYKFAAHAHQGQTVPGTNLPYIMHLSCVSMEIIAALTAEVDRHGNLAVECALLHDTIEDTQVTEQQVAQEFGEAVAAGVLALSKDKNLAKSLQLSDSLRRIRQQPLEVWMVKLADRITNLQPPPPHWSIEKIERYRVEALEILEALGAASPFLSSRLQEKIRIYAV